jgi:ubiquinone/menaquinone biosynthesis C-methylase UbiE
MKGMLYMGNIEKYYENTENALPNPTVRKFIEMKIKPSNAIDLGCGAGRDTIYLIKNGWEVLSIDRENTEEIIANKLDKEDIERFRFNKQDFENVELKENNLLVANFSIPFCNKEFFNEFWNKISNSILKERILCG